MLDRSSNKIRENFLKKFTEDLVIAKRDEINARKKQDSEKERIRKEIASEKLRQRYIEPRKKERQMLESEKDIEEQPVQIPQEPISIPKRQAQYQTKSIKRPAPMPIAIFPQQLQRNLQSQSQINPSSSYLNLGKINILLKDPAVSSVECGGPDKNIIIKKNGQIMKSEIKLSEKEIDSIIAEFSEKARIPLVEGMLRARVENLQISAVVSKVTASRFIITKTTMPTFSSLVQLQQKPVIQTIRSVQPIPPIRFEQKTPAPPRQPMQQIRPAQTIQQTQPAQNISKIQSSQSIQQTQPNTINTINTGNKDSKIRRY